MIALPRDAYHHLIFTLRPLLPPLADTQEAIARRDHAAVAQVAALCPANAAQAALAAQHVAANAQAMECLRISRDPATTPETALRCTAQAASMMRQSQGALRLLLRAQEVNTKRAADGTTAWSEHCAEQWMMEALRTDPVTPAAMELSENPHQRPARQYAETDSGVDLAEAHSPPAGLDPIDQHCETDSGVPITSREDHDMGFRLVLHDHETDSTGPAPPARSHGTGFYPTHQYHETDLCTASPAAPEAMHQLFAPSAGWDPGRSGSDAASRREAFRGRADTAGSGQDRVADDNRKNKIAP